MITHSVASDHHTTPVVSPACPHLDQPSPRQPGTLFEQFGAIATYLSIPDFVTEAMPGECWQYCRERCIPHVRGAKK